MGYFPSFSAGWVISNEAFMKNTASWLGFLKVRAGWGQNGNDNILIQIGVPVTSLAIMVFIHLARIRMEVQPELTRIVWLTPI